ncbi:unnamed protein product [Ilex paraguariensis]|uniref:Uncharacterized protein n=1 Tax=Ilex paraguariensis TaxID=185542 RepID=A0ABC8U0M0_9AQUA
MSGRKVVGLHCKILFSQDLLLSCGIDHFARIRDSITIISPANKLHPRDDVLATGSSRSLFIWKPKEKFEIEQPPDEKKIILCGKAEK